ncbi:hypothetical protein [Halorhabdus salina]|uniref:hypothetical protein n=1 Tax=Halorhabdus salina TaxID=2750670 RepID=UPI0015EF6373|nr:hypothetical protein [Halorhabdus salina]
MVKDHITDGERIAAVLRAEIDGRGAAGLERLSIGTVGDDATTITLDGESLAEIVPREMGVEIRFRQDVAAVRSAAETTALEARKTDDAAVVVVDSAAATKSAVDLLVAVADRLT